MFMSVLQNFNMKPHIKDFTHVTASSSTCIDNIISNIKGTGRVHFLGLSRHAAQTFTTEAGKQPRITHWSEYRRDFSTENMNKFISCMSSLSFSEVMADNNFESAFYNFHELLTLFFELCFPKIKMKRNIKRKKSWITKGLKKSCRVKRDMYLSIRSRINSLCTADKYRKYSHILRKCIHLSHKQTNQRYISNAKNICSAAWKIVKGSDVLRPPTFIKEIEDNNSILKTDPQQISETFNDHFIDNVQSNLSNTKGDGRLK